MGRQELRQEAGPLQILINKRKLFELVRSHKREARRLDGEASGNRAAATGALRDFVIHLNLSFDF